MAVNKFFKILIISLLCFISIDLNAQIPAGEGFQNSPKFSNYVDLTSAAEHSVQAVVHIKTEFKQKNSAWDRYFSGSFWEEFF